MKISWYQTITFKLCLLLAFFAIVPLLFSGGFFLSRMEGVLLEEQKEAVDKQLGLVSSNVELLFDTMFNDVRYYAEGNLLQTIDDSITSYMGTQEPTLMRPGRNGPVEQGIFQSFEEFGESHPVYQYVYMGTEQGGYIQYPDTYISAGYDPRVRPWYPIAREQPGQPTLGGPYYFTEDDIVIVGVSQTILDSRGNILGVMALDTSLDTLTASFEESSKDAKGYYMLVTGEGIILADPNEPANNFQSVAETYGAAFWQEASQGADFHPISLEGQQYFIKSVFSEKTGWYYISVVSQAEMFQSVYALQKTIWVELLVVLLVLILVGWVMSNSLSKPIRAVSQCAWEVAEGNFDIDLAVKATGEIRLLVECFHKIGRTLTTYKSYIGEISATLEKIAQGDVAFGLELDYMGEFGPIKEALLHISKAMSEMLAQIKSSSDQLLARSGQMETGAYALGQGSTEQAAAVEQLSSAVSEIADQVASNAKMTQQASDFSKVAVNGVVTGNKQMQKMIDAMGEIDGRAHEISKIIKVIDDIAFQTNILALNAAVEAVRAGNAGKGFAVVAEEVRNLAQLTAGATQNTEDLIESALRSVERGVNIVGQTAHSLGDIMGNVEDLSGLLERIAAASSQQSSSIHQTEVGLEQISVVVQSNAAIASQSAQFSQQLSVQAKLLNALVSRFHFITSK